MGQSLACTWLASVASCQTKPDLSFSPCCKTHFPYSNECQSVFTLSLHVIEHRLIYNKTKYSVQKGFFLYSLFSFPAAVVVSLDLIEKNFINHPSTVLVTDWQMICRKGSAKFKIQESRFKKSHSTTLFSTKNIKHTIKINWIMCYRENIPQHCTCKR